MGIVSLLSLAMKPVTGFSPMPWEIRAFHTMSFLVYSNMSWTVETLDETVDAEVEALPEDMRARPARIATLIEDKGLEHVGEPHVKHVVDQLWEIRLKGRSGIARALYVTAGRQRVLIVRVFVKKTEKTPRREIALALSRAKSVHDRRYRNGAHR